VRVATREHVEVDRAVAREGVEHVIEEGNSGVGLGLAAAVEIDPHANRGLRRFALHLADTPAFAGRQAGPYSGRQAGLAASLPASLRR
jgi:hypothetical protein